MDNNTDIKKMWEQGFLHHKIDLHQHEINSIMKRDSENIVDKIKRTASKDHKAMPLVASLLVLPLLVFGYYKFGIFLTGVFSALYYLNSHMLSKLDSVKIKDNTLQYLLAIRSLFKYMKTYYTSMLGVGMPLIAIPVLLFTLDMAGIPLESFFAPQSRWLAISILIVCAGLFSFVGIFSYRFSVKTLYGQDLKRIDRIIRELSENETDKPAAG